MLHNCVVLAPPLCGARMLVRQLAETFCMDPGSKLLPCGYDPSLSSYEDAPTAHLNSRLFAHHKLINNWNLGSARNPFSFFLDHAAARQIWRPELAAVILLRMEERQPWIRKDPQFCYVLPYWLLNVWHSGTALPRFVVLIRPPDDWINAIFSRCVPGAWPDLPKDVSHFVGLWLDYARHLLRLLHDPAVAGNAIVLTLEDLCHQAGHERLQQHLGVSQFERLSLLDSSKIRHLSRRHDLLGSNRILEIMWDCWLKILRASGSSKNGLALPEKHAVFNSIPVDSLAAGS